MYHNFSDVTTVFGISNFWNVISNIPFLIVGVFGLFALKKIKQVKPQFVLFFTGVSMVAFGSGYYHLLPNNGTLIWGRLPMTVAFMSLISMVISEFIDDDFGKKIFYPLIVLGFFSIVFWILTGDLRVYVFVQFYPLLALPIILICFQSKLNVTKGYWMILWAYVIAKIFETFDVKIHETLTIISGHTLKHIAATIGIFILIKTYQKQQKIHCQE